MGSNGDRSDHFPAIERKHGGPIAMWIDRLSELGDAKYPEQIAYLRENHGFSQAHANALVMYVRGSSTSKRFATPDAFFASLDPVAARTSREIFSTVLAARPDLELVTAWNQPMLRWNRAYVLGLSATTKHLLLNSFSADVLAAHAELLAAYAVKKYTFRVPHDWDVDTGLLLALVDARLAEVRAGSG